MGKNKSGGNHRVQRVEQNVQQPQIQQGTENMNNDDVKREDAPSIDAPADSNVSALNVPEQGAVEQTSTQSMQSIDEVAAIEAKQAAESTGEVRASQEAPVAPTPAPAPTAPVQETTQVRQETQPNVVSLNPTTKGTTVTKTQEAVISDFEAWVANVKAEGPKPQQRLIGTIELYMNSMKPGMSINGDVGAKHQYQFWMAIKQVIDHSAEEDFRRLWSTILRFFHEFRDGVFHDRYIHRFAEFWTQDPAQLMAYQNLVNLIKLTADPADRKKGLKQVSLDRTLEGSVSELGKQRIMTFYMQ